MVQERVRSLGVADLASALPTATAGYRRNRKKLSQSSMPPTFPVCFAEVWRRRKSSLAAHRRERASLEAVASTIPEEARAFTGEAAAAVYLGALVTSLERLVDTTNPVQSGIKEAKHSQKMTKQEKRRLKKKTKEAEDSVRDMSVPQLMASANRRDDVDGEDDELKVTDSNEDIDLASSLVYLTGLAASGCSTAVLNAKADHVLDITMRVYDHVAGHQLVARHTPQICATVLAVLGASSWSNPTMQRAYLYLLRQTTDSDLKSRRKARDSLVSLLNCPRAPIIRMRTSSTTTSFFVNQIKAYDEFFGSTLRDPELEMSQVSSLLSLLTCVELVSGSLKPIDAAKLSKHLVVITTKTQPGVMAFAFKALASLISRNQPEVHSEDARKMEPRIPQNDLKKLVLAMLQNELPEEPSDDLRETYARCIQVGGSAYASYFEHASTSNELIVRCVQRVFSMLSAKAQPNCIRSISAALQNLVTQRWFTTRSDVLTVLQGLLSESFKPIWKEVVPVLKAYIEKDMTSGSPAMSDAMQKLLQILLKKRQQAYDQGDGKGLDMLQSLIGSVARGGGSSHIFSQCRLEYDDKEHVTNAWLLPLLRDNIRGAPVNLFSTTCVPLAMKLNTALDTMRKENRFVEAKNIANYISQIWGLLPAFCTQPSDLWHEGSLNTLFQAIYHCLTDEKNLTMYSIGVGGLRQLSISIESLPPEGSKTEDIRLSFASRVKKLYPAISDVNEKTSDERRGMLMEAMTTACRATNNPAIALALLRKSVRRLLELRVSMSNEVNKNSGSSEEYTKVLRKQHAATDLAIAIAESRIIPFDASEVGFLEKALTPFFSSQKETALQKKAYRASTLLLSMRKTDPASPEFASFLDAISKAGKTVASGAKAARQSLVATLINGSLRINPGPSRVAYMEKLNDMFLSEVIMGTRDVSEKTRAASFETLVTMARTWNASSSGADYSGLKRFFFAVTAGLGARTVPMIACTVTALGRLIYDFRGEALMNEEFRKIVDSMFATVSESDTTMADKNTENDELASERVEPGLIAILLRHNDVEVQKAALGVVKVATKVLAEPSTRLSAVLPGVVPGLVYVAATSKKQEMRLRVRVVFERILRKCGYDALHAVFPAEHRKLLSAVRKKYSRDMLKKHAAKDKRQQKGAFKAQMVTQEDGDGGVDVHIDDSDSDVERDIVDGDELLQAGMRRAKHSRDQKSSDVMDLLDSNGKGMIDGTNGGNGEALPFKRQKNKANDVAKYSKDGRLILVESDDDSGLAEIGSASETSDDEDGQRPLNRSSNSATVGKRARTQLDDDRHTKRLKGSFGEEYKSRRGSGDVKRAGRPDPYAYVPLGMEMIGPGARPGLIGAKRNRKGSSLSKLVRGNRGKRSRGKPTGVPGKR